MTYPQRLPGATILSIVGLSDGVLVYTGRLASKRMTVGDPVPIQETDGRRYYRIAGALYNASLVLQSVETQDPQWIDNGANARAKTATLKPRDLEIYEKLKAGGVYADIGATYGLSRQRIKQIVDKLASHGLLVSAKEVRMEARAAAYSAAKESKYGASHAQISDNPELRQRLVERVTHKRNNARVRGIPFDLTISDLYPLPEVCPALGIPIHYETGSRGAADNALSIDRIDSNLGYVKGNIVLVSQRANRIKNDATVDELRKIYEFYRDLGAPTTITS